MNQQKIADILSKRPLSASQINLLKCIRDAGVVGISREDLATKLFDGNRRRINGVFLALSRRIGSDSTDCPEFFNHFEPRYTMRPALWNAIQSMPKLHKVMANQTVDEIHDRFDSNGLKPKPVPVTA